MTHYMKYSLLGTRKVISSIITRNFFVTRKKQPVTIGAKRMCISRDDNCVNTMGAFHYAKVTGQRSVGIPDENGTTYSDQTGSTNKIGSCHFKFFYQIP